MGDHGASPTCLSAQPHGAEAIRDFSAHYFGCIEIFERPHFLHRSNPLWDEELKLEMKRLRQQDARRGTKTEDFRPAAERIIFEKLRNLAVSIESQHERTENLRKAIEKVGCTHLAEEDLGKFEDRHPPGCNLVDCLVESHEGWKKSEEFNDGARKIQQWKHQPEETFSWQQSADTIETQGETIDLGRVSVRRIIEQAREEAFEKDQKLGKYVLESDVNVFIVQWEILGHEGELDNDNHSDHALTNSNASLPTPLSQQSSRPKPGRSKFRDTQESATDILSGTDFRLDGQINRGRGMVPLRSSWFNPPVRRERFLKPIEEDTMTDYRFKGNFPDQNLSLQVLLEKQPPMPNENDGILNRNRHPNRMRYIHIPHNNMEVGHLFILRATKLTKFRKWIERAIAGYFGDDEPDHGRTYREPSSKTKSHMVLRPEYWRGQQYGGVKGIVQARHMRPLCERMSSEIWDSEDNPKNLVLFMPYLHWEEDRKHDKIARIIHQETAKWRAQQETNGKTEKKERIEERTLNGKPLHTIKPLDHPVEDPVFQKKVKECWERFAINSSETPPRTVADLAAGLGAKRMASCANERYVGDGIEYGYQAGGRKLWYVARLERSKHGRLIARTSLGQFLLDAARLYDAMAMHRDQKLLETYLHYDPPLHPRRTLDQSYYRALKTTQGRDRDQVVYRGTCMDDRNMHRFLEERERNCPGLRNCINQKTTMDKLMHPRTKEDLRGCSHDSTPLGIFRWTDHWKKEDVGGCDHCKSEICKVGKLIMVDQLWMWILDNRTIITSFPEKYGTNDDNLNVHMSVRNRIRNAPKNKIRSVFDLGLVILDECANGLLDYSLDSSKKPRVLDIFTETISNLAHQQTVLRDRVRTMTAPVSNLFSEGSWHMDGPYTILKLVQVHFQGLFLDDIKKVIDELNIMIRMSEQHRIIVRRFQKHAEAILNSHDHLPDREPQTGRGQIPNDSSDRSTTTSNVERSEDLFNWFHSEAKHLVSKIDDRIEELEGLKKTAETTSRDINEIHNIITQQVNTLQALQAETKSSETVKNGRIIMVFTIVTVIFLPLSFMSSVFGMNNSTIGSDRMTFGDQANFIFLISAAVILVSITFAFWKLPRTVFLSAYKILETWLLVKSGAYYCWLMIREHYLFWSIYYILKSLEKKPAELAEMKREVENKRQRAKNERMEAAPKKNEREGDGQEDDRKPAATAQQNAQQARVYESGTNVGSFSSWSRLYRRKKVPDAGV